MSLSFEIFYLSYTYLFLTSRSTRQPWTWKHVQANKYSCEVGSSGNVTQKQTKFHHSQSLALVIHNRKNFDSNFPLLFLAENHSNSTSQNLFFCELCRKQNFGNASHSCFSSKIVQTSDVKNHKNAPYTNT